MRLGQFDAGPLAGDPDLLTLSEPTRVRILQPELALSLLGE